MSEAIVLEKPRVSPWGVDGFERALSLAATALLLAVVIALAKGWSEWGLIPKMVWAHIATIMVALMLTPVMLLRPRGTTLHRQLGRVWASAMLLTALFTFDIRLINEGQFSIIHILSAWTVIQVPVIIWSARSHNVKRHRRSVRGMVLGALLIAGFFTFPFGRLMGSWLFG